MNGEDGMKCEGEQVKAGTVRTLRRRSHNSRVYIIGKYSNLPGIPKNNWVIFSTATTTTKATTL